MPMHGRARLEPNEGPDSSSSAAMASRHSHLFPQSHHAKTNLFGIIYTVINGESTRAIKIVVSIDAGATRELSLREWWDNSRVLECAGHLLVCAMQ